MDSIKTIAILGTGSLGIDLGLLAALHDFNVILWHRKDANVAQDRLDVRLEKYVKKGILTMLDQEKAIDRIGVTSRLQDLSSVDMAIETIAEDFTEKSRLLSKVSHIVSKDCIITSNTSSLSIEDLAGSVDFPRRFAGLHFFNPALKMELVEIVAGSETAGETIASLGELAACLGKTSVQVNDAPGFIVNRLMACQMREAILLAEQGVASPEDIDVAVKLGLAHPIGPLALADLIGLDVMLAIFKTLYKGTRSSSFEPPKQLEQMVSDGVLGRKTGRGFFAY